MYIQLALISSLFPNDYPSDYLVDPNDPYYLASKIVTLSNNKKLQMEMSEQNFMFSHARNNAEHIDEQIAVIYKDIINKNIKSND